MAAPTQASVNGIAQQGELAELLRLEAILAERWTSLELEVEHIAAEAQARRRSAEADAGTRLETDLVALSARVEGDRRGRIRGIGQAAEEDARGLRAIDDTSLDTFAELVVERVLAAATEDAPS